MRPTWGWVLTALLIVLALIPAPASAQRQAGPAYVTRVVDGTTLYADVDGRMEAVRYLGVRVPHIEDPTYGFTPYDVAAREANRRLVQGKWIWLVFDREPRDEQGRLRAWVWRDTLFVNGALVRSGWAVNASTDPQLAEYFGTFETAARQDGRGLWRSPRSIAYYRPVPPGTVDNDMDGIDTRVFSAPAPFGPSRSATPGTGSSPSGPANIPNLSSSPMSGGAGYAPRSTGSTRTVR